MNMIEKFGTSLVPAGALSAIIFPSTRADSMRPAQSAKVIATADAPQARVDPFNYLYAFTQWVTFARQWLAVLERDAAILAERTAMQLD